MTVLSAAEGFVEATAFSWMASGDLQIPLQLRLDHLSSLMILVVTGIGSLIHIYSTGYMHEESDGEYARYFSYLNLFAAFMLVLVLGANFPVMFVGWEGVGLCSYLLIGFWFKKKSAADAGKKAFVVNRIGDFGFILGMLLVFTTFGTLDFQEVAAAAAQRAPEVAGWGVITIATLLLFVGATGKSAQIPLYIWLPDAMEGPTPVSALIHAATMVTAGVYMIGRNAVLFDHAPTTLAIVAAVGVATALMAGTIGLVQNDIKRVLAYSTVSQLGYMFLAMGVGAYAAGIFHLYTHAFFKALLFLGSGAVIHALAGEQDLRNMGGLKKYLPITYWTFLIGALAIAGVPLLSGFFSKDEILFRTFTAGVDAGPHADVAHRRRHVAADRDVHVPAGVPAFHGERRHDAPAAPAHDEEEEPVAARARRMIFRLKPEATRRHGHAVPVASGFSRKDDAHDHGHGGHGHGHDPHEAPWSMALPLILLAVGSIFAGYVGVPHALGGSNRIESFLEPSFEAHSTAAHAPRQRWRSRRPRLARQRGPCRGRNARRRRHRADADGDLERHRAVAGIGIAMYFWLRNRSAADRMAQSFGGLYRLLLDKYRIDELYDAMFVQPIKLLSTMVLWRGVDAGMIDGAVNGVGAMISGSSSVLRRMQTGSVRTYAFALFAGAVAILGYYLFR